MKNVAKRFLNLDLDYWGYILADESVPKSVLRQEPFLSTYPYSPAASCVYQLARRVLGQPVRNGGPNGNGPGGSGGGPNGAHHRHDRHDRNGGAGQHSPFSLVTRDGVPEEV